jgi:hypothetical protein
MNKSQILEAVLSATTHSELDAIIDAYLAEIGDDSERAKGESYAETAARLGGDDILRAAESRWFEIEAA